MSTAKDQQLDKGAGQPARSGAAAGGTTQGEGNIGGTGGGAPDKAEGLVTSVADMTIGSLDPRGRRVTDIYWKTGDYVIFRAQGRISPMFSDDRDTSAEQRKRYMQLGTSLSRVNSLDPGQTGGIRDSGSLFRRLVGEKRPDRARGTGSGYEAPPPGDFFNREIARAIALSLENLDEPAKALLADLETKIVNRTQIGFRMIYLYSAFAVMSLYVLATLWSTYGGNPVPDSSTLTGPFSQFIDGNTALLRAMAMGALASFFSVLLGIQGLQFDVDAMYARGGYLYTFWLGSSRIIIGIIAGLFVYTAIRSGVVFAGLDLSPTADSAKRATLYVVAFTSGFSEAFVPNILKNVESRHANAGSGKQTA